MIYEVTTEKTRGELHSCLPCSIWSKKSGSSNTWKAIKF